MIETGAHILITGGGTGIGRALALHYAATGVRLTLIGPEPAPLAATALDIRKKGGQAVTACLDVRDTDAMACFIRQCDSCQPLDIVIANAGVNLQSTQLDRQAEVYRESFGVNMTGVANTVLPALEGMLHRKAGRIAITASQASFIVTPGTGAYNASKIGARIFGESLRGLVWRDGIRVSVIHPGFVRTALTASNRFPMPFMLTPEAAARCIARGIAKGKGRIIFPWRLYLLGRLFGALPHPIRDWLLRLR